MYNGAQELLDKTKQVVQDYIEDLGYELVDLSLSKTRGNMTLKVLTDKPRGGISLKECADLNQGLSAILDRENTLGESYVLEVSSPGIDRPLTSRKDFLRAQARQIRVVLSEPIEGKYEITGIITKVEDDYLFLDSGEPKIIDGERGRTIRIPLNKIKKAKQLIK
ncbi:MAG: ribosome maturation factor RimP [Candidatus Omnitrophota bacterium]